MPKGIKRQLEIASKNVRQEISDNAKGGFIAGGLSAEGYAGGYQQAIYDVIAALNGVPASSSSRYWPRESNLHPDVMEYRDGAIFLGRIKESEDQLPRQLPKIKPLTQKFKW